MHCLNLTSNAITNEDATIYPRIETCGKSCACDYVSFESFLKDLPELQNKTGASDRDFESEIREKISHYSRLFDKLVGVNDGFFSKAHKCKQTFTFKSNRTSHIYIGLAVSDSIEMAKDGKLLAENSFEFREGYLIFKPCDFHLSGCFAFCANSRIKTSMPFPLGCYEISARWGNSCADKAVEAAVKAYILKSFRTLDPAQAAQAGIQPSYANTPPYEWSELVKAYKARYAGGGVYLMA